MAHTLKDQNLPRLAAVAAANWILLSVFAIPDLASLAQWQSVSPIAGSAMGVALVSILNGLLGPKTKARLVYFRWSQPLPGSYAFSKLSKEDPRIDRAQLRRVVGHFPRSPDQQNALWYKLYDSVKAHDNVLQNHREYLFARDYCGLAALFVPTLGLAGLWLIAPLPKAACYLGLLVFQYALVRFVAANHGRRFVSTVLAVKSAKD